MSCNGDAVEGPCVEDYFRVDRGAPGGGGSGGGGVEEGGGGGGGGSAEAAAGGGEGDRDGGGGGRGGGDREGGGGGGGRDEDGVGDSVGDGGKCRAGHGGGGGAVDGGGERCVLPSRESLAFGDRQPSQPPPPPQLEESNIRRWMRLTLGLNHAEVDGFVAAVAREMEPRGADIEGRGGGGGGFPAVVALVFSNARIQLAAVATAAVCAGLCGFVRMCAGLCAFLSALVFL